VSGTLVDVSAGGLKAQCPGGGWLRPGSPVDVEITVEEPPPASVPRGVHLRGCALIVRVEAHAEPGASRTALRFVGPLTLREPFSQLLLF
jgi:hypothetical protein